MCGFHRSYHEGLNLGVHSPQEIGLTLRIQVFLKLSEGELVPDFMFPIALAFLLNRIIRQMDQLLIDLAQSERLRGRSQVSLLIQESLKIPIERDQEHKHAYIELPSIVQHWILNVFLNHIRPSLDIFSRLVDEPENLV